MHELANILAGGAALGTVYALLALGLTLVYGVARVFNFAHGSFFTWGAYLAYVFLVRVGLGYPATFAIVIPIMFAIGLLVERTIARPLRFNPNFEFTSIVATLGLAFLMDYMVLRIFGGRLKALPELFSGSVSYGGVVMSVHELAIVGISIGLVVALTLFLSRTRLGLSMQALSQDVFGANLVGIHVGRTFGYTFGISAALAGLAGILLSPLFFLRPLGGWEILAKSFVIVAFGGLGSMQGTLIAAIILGMVESLITGYIGAVWTIVGWFVILLLILIIRPRGLFGVWE